MVKSSITVSHFDIAKLKKLYIPLPSSHKGQNGKLLLIGGSRLFHAASLWSLKVASRLVDMVFYSSVPENNQIVMEAKKEFRDGIVIPREQLESYVDEADCVLIGPGMVRAKREVSSGADQVVSIKEINYLEDEGEQTYFLTKYLLHKYPQKKWVIDGGALQMMDPEWLRKMPEVILTPHRREFETLMLKVKNEKLKVAIQDTKIEEEVKRFAQEYGCVVLLKGQEDIVCSPTECVIIQGGNAGMTKGGTGDVLAGLVAALACKNDLYLAAQAGSYINKKAGEQLFMRVGYYFNSSDLVEEIPHVMKRLILE
jgi:NAD(P)H-hydrate epimerase